MNVEITLLASLSAPDELLLRLRAATRGAHTAIERNARMRRLLSRDLTRLEYVRLLHDLMTWHAALDVKIDAQLRQLSPSDGPYRWQPRHAWLANDLRDLGASDPVTGDAGAMPPLRTRDDLVGVLYVVEGATQGGRILAPLLEKRLGVTALRGARYFNAFRHDGWEAYRAWARSRSPHIDHAAAARAAIATFTTLHQHLDRTPRSTVRAERSA